MKRPAWPRHNVGMNIVILDDYQDAVRKLHCASRLDAYTAKVYTNTVKGLGQLSVRLRDADIIVLVRDEGTGLSDASRKASREVLDRLASQLGYCESCATDMTSMLVRRRYADIITS